VNLRHYAIRKARAGRERRETGELEHDVPLALGLIAAERAVSEMERASRAEQAGGPELDLVRGQVLLVIVRHNSGLYGVKRGLVSLAPGLQIHA